MIVLSLFDGISCGQIALERCGIKVDKYYASEIKPKAIEITQQHYPNTIQIGDVTKVSFKDGVLYTEKGNYNVGKIDLLIGGSPCQDFSCLKNTRWGDANGYYGEKSKLFWEYVRLLKEVKPKYFLLENVKMKKEYEINISNILGYTPTNINSSLVSFQTRNRLYWTNINKGIIPLPSDKNISLQDNLDTNINNLEEAKMNYTPSRIRMWNNGNGGKLGACRNITNSDKCNCITRKQDRCPNSGLIAYKDFARFLTRTEIEKAQTLPLGYLKNCSYNQMCDLAGDGWTVDIISHIFALMDLDYDEPSN